MGYHKLVCFTIISSALILTNCASTNQVTELYSKMEILNTKIDQVNNDIDLLRPDIEYAKNESTRANKRLDNKVSFYRK